LSQAQPILDLYVFEDSAADSLFRFVASSKAAKIDGTLKRVAVGHYQATLPMLVPGEYRIDITEERKGRKIPYPPVGFTSTFDPKREMPRPEVNLSLLTRLAQTSGGEVNPASVEILERRYVTKTSQPARGLLIVLAAVLFFFEIAARRLFLGES
jgi:hypothetical protein